MAIKFTCPHCHKALRADDHLAGRRAACSGCKKGLTIPAPTSLPADVEEFAAAALADQPAAPAPAAAAPISFNCPQCDEKIQVSGELAGKQTPCPECRRIIKVPLPVKNEPKDWRKVSTRGSGFLRDQAPAPEGAWGSTGAGAVSRQALEEAQAIPIDRELLTWQQWARRGTAAVVALVLVGGASWWGIGYWNLSRQRQALSRALEFVDTDKKLSPDAAAEIHRAAGEYLLRAGQADKARERLQKARALLAADQVPSSEWDAVLIDVAVTQVDLGGEKTDVDSGARVSWDEVEKEIRQTLAQLRSREARLEAVREVNQKLIAKNQGLRAAGIIHRLNLPDEAAELLALVGLELLRAKETKAAQTLAEQAQALVLAPPAAPADGKPPKRPVPPATLLALWLALNRPEQARALAAEPGAGPEPDPAVRIGYAEGLARQGHQEAARKYASLPGLPQGRVQALIAVAGVALENGQTEAARQDLEAAANLIDAELRGRALSPWVFLRLNRLAVQANLGERVQPLSGSIPDPALRGRAQLEILRGRLRSCRTQAEEAWAQAVEKESPAHALALEAIARHNARHAGAGVQKSVDGWEPDRVRPFGYIGVALGLQDGS
jgi:hypothetical protein